MAALVLLSPAVQCQERPAAPRPQFDVASLQPDDGCENAPPGFRNLSPSPGRLELPCVTLAGLLRYAFGTFGDGVTINTQPLRTEGGPAWMRSDYYSLLAKADGPARAEMLAGPMLQAFLEERFRLKTHRELRDMPVYSMTVGKGGLKGQPLTAGAWAPIDLTHAPSPPKPGEPLPNLCGAMLIMPRNGNGEMTIEVQGSTLTQFAQRLSGRVDRALVDKTGIPGMFDFHLEFMPDAILSGQGVPAGREGDPGNAADTGNPASRPDLGPDLFVALPEQIGLKLSPDKGSVSFLIVDQVEKPTAN